MHADDVPVRHLAGKFGTPLYVYSESAIRERYQQFDQAFQGSDHTVCYSVKANSNLSILRMLAKLGAGFDIVSGGELQRVLTINRNLAARVVFSGVGKRIDEIDLALQSEILLFNVESASELELLSARTTHLRKTAKFAVRVNPDVKAKTHPYISTGLHQHKFGVQLRDARELYRQGAANRRLRAVAVSAHSRITDHQRPSLSGGHATHCRVSVFARGLTDIIPVRRCRRRPGYLLHPRYRRELQHRRSQVCELAAWTTEGLGNSPSAGAGPLYHWPIRSVASVLYRKRNNGKGFLVVDAAMNDLIRPSLYGAHHEIVPATLSQAHRKLEILDVVGPVCETGDFFAHDRKLPRVEEGELLVILDAGAYGMSLASNYNSRPRAAEVVVNGRRTKLVRKRESISDLWAAEVP